MVILRGCAEQGVDTLIGGVDTLNTFGAGPVYRRSRNTGFGGWSKPRIWEAFWSPWGTGFWSRGAPGATPGESRGPGGPDFRALFRTAMDGFKQIGVNFCPELENY